ncbi:ABATE domain-containing protein [Streptomyces sp. NPDC001276]|uniref:ABATE domain-containing protein n=1 Tax=Streptomyces sp. NPDC001276 TaxID=3364555 RepID=UPI0036BE55FD
MGHQDASSSSLPCNEWEALSGSRFDASVRTGVLLAGWPTIERICTPGLLDSWFLDSGRLDQKPGSGPADLRAAVDLRKAIYALLGARLTAAGLCPPGPSPR